VLKVERDKMQAEADELAANRAIFGFQEVAEYGNIDFED
jgi:hypothetical protein